MKIKILFSYPGDKEPPIVDTPSQRYVYIYDPFTIEFIDGGRQIKHSEGSLITYENYCHQLKEIITDTVAGLKSDEMDKCTGIQIESCKEPPNFAVLNQALSKINIPFAEKCDLIYKDCSFSGTLFVNAVKTFIESARKVNSVRFNLTIEEKEPSKLNTEDNKSPKLSTDEKPPKLSTHDKAKLAAIPDVVVFATPQSNAEVRRFTDDQAIDTKIAAHLNNPSYFFRAPDSQQNYLPRNLLIHFFHAAHQQRNDYTCGPATVKMVIDYYVTMSNREKPFCHDSLSSPEVWKRLNTDTESQIAERVKTTEEVGSGILNIRNGLLELKLNIIDDYAGLSNKSNNEDELKQHKEKLLEKFNEILQLGIPIIINMQNREGIGHYEVVIGIDKKNNIILAEPGTALEGKIEFETVAKEAFIPRWKNMSGEFHGRFLILCPNFAAAEKINAILSDLFHYFNGEEINTISKKSLFH